MLPPNYSRPCCSNITPNLSSVSCSLLQQTQLKVEPSPSFSSSPHFFSQDSLLYRPCNLETSLPSISSCFQPLPLSQTHTCTFRIRIFLCRTVILYICPLATEHCGYCILFFFFFSCHLCMMSVQYFLDATKFLWPLGDNKEFYSILFLPFLSLFPDCVFLVTPFFPTALLFSAFLLFLVLYVDRVAFAFLCECYQWCVCHFWLLLCYAVRLKTLFLSKCCSLETLCLRQVCMANPTDMLCLWCLSRAASYCVCIDVCLHTG